MEKKKICLAITEEAHQRLKEKAKSKGINVSTLIQIYAMEEDGKNKKPKGE